MLKQQLKYVCPMTNHSLTHTASVQFRRKFPSKQSNKQTSEQTNNYARTYSSVTNNPQACIASIQFETGSPRQGDTRETRTPAVNNETMNKQDHQVHAVINHGTGHRLKPCLHTELHSYTLPAEKNVLQDYPVRPSTVCASQATKEV